MFPCRRALCPVALARVFRATRDHLGPVEVAERFSRWWLRDLERRGLLLPAAR